MAGPFIACTMTVLITGGKVKTASCLACLLKDGNKPFLVASRSGGDPTDEFPSCRFDWLDATTYAIPWSKVEEITSVYLVPPPVLDMLPPMKAFIDYCREKGVERFVLLSASVVEPGGPAAGKVHEYLVNIGVEYCVLRPTWFMGESEILSRGSGELMVLSENFSKQPRKPVKPGDNIYSATGEGKVPFVSVEDIAAVAFHALVDLQSHNTDHYIRGPELLSYDEVIHIF
ncbi:putative ergot alkaloid A [Armillaria luteobubalina]|uniref:Ergot alkaloid A n=1 Tax=Armillaria luteobubalina TaxID=153913 RepID=A0AA39UVR0_9AGAR|nr:putative ergot alkaloid A [Armillaria luteobubalina]